MPYNIWCGGCGNHIGMGECMLHDNISDIYCVALNFCWRKTTSKFKVMCVGSASMIPRGQFLVPIPPLPSPLPLAWGFHRTLCPFLACYSIRILYYFIVAFHTLGVRYNAEKKKVGNYYTTPIYRFRMKCHLCDNHFEIETDPKVSPLNPNIHIQILPLLISIYFL